MIKVEVIEDFTLQRFDELTNIVRHNLNKNEHGRLYVKDTFECNKEIAEYLIKTNKLRRPFVKVLEEKDGKVVPKKTTKKKTSIKND